MRHDNGPGTGPGAQRAKRAEAMARGFLAGAIIGTVVSGVTLGTVSVLTASASALGLAYSHASRDTKVPFIKSTNKKRAASKRCQTKCHGTAQEHIRFYVELTCSPEDSRLDI